MSEIFHLWRYEEHCRYLNRELQGVSFFIDGFFLKTHKYMIYRLLNGQEIDVDFVSKNEFDYSNITDKEYIGKGAYVRTVF